MGCMVEVPPYLSPSSASAFDGCPRRWHFKYVERLPDPPGEAAVVGTFVHEVLEHLCQFDPAERTLDRAKELARELWPAVETHDDFAALELAADDARAFRWKAWLAIAGLWELEDPATVEVVATEQKITADLDGVPFLGIVDRLDRIKGRLVVSDYKSGNLPGVRFRDDKYQQVMLYAAAIEASEGEQPDQARLLYLGQKMLEVTVTPRKVEAAVAKLNETWTAINGACASETFEPRTTVLCGWCPFADRCPEGQAELARRQAAGRLPAHAPAAALVA